MTPTTGRTDAMDDTHETEDRLLNVDEVAGLLGTTARFPRRLISERRIRFVRLSRGHVRIPESAVREFIASRIVEPIRSPWSDGRVA